MSRRPASGTPTRAEGYVYPGNRRRTWRWAGGIAGIVVVLLVGLYFVGVESTLSPGPVIAAHAPIETECVLCHAVGAVADDIRCERCHDSAGTGRLTNASHVLFGSGDARKAARAEAVACRSCHTDHRGREHPLREADDRECGTCHEFSSLRRHPEFAAVSAGAQTGLGLKFPHDRHMVDVQRDLGTGCAACHVPTADLADFEPVSFDRHCASCHAPDGFLTGKTGKMSAELLVLNDELPSAWRQPELAVDGGGPPSRRRVEASNLRHRDPWVMYNAIKLSRELAPEVERAEVAALEARLTWLEQQRRENPLRALDADQLAGFEASLQLQLEDLEARLAAAAAAGAGDDAAALQRLGESAATLAAELDRSGVTGAALAPGETLAGSVAALETRLRAVAAPPPEDDAAAADRLERRKEELLALLDAIAARGDEALAERAADLRDDIEDIAPQAGDEPADVAALQAQLDALDEALRTVAEAPDPQGRVGAAQVASLRDLAGQRIGGGLAPADFADRRRELLDLIDAIERRAGDELALQASQLRSAVLALRIGDAGDLDLRRQAAAVRRALARVRLERELAAQGAAAGPVGHARQRPLALGSQRDLAAIEATVGQVRARLDELRAGPRGSVAVGADERRLRQATLSSLYAACLKCHEQGPARLAPVRVARPVMSNSIFNHAPHVTQVDCAACHGDAGAEQEAARGIYASGSATDVNVPGVASCRACHNPADVSADCETCHRYHPPSIGALLRQP